MFTTVAFSESHDPAGAYANVAAIPDQHARTEGDFIRADNTYNKLLGALACVGTLGSQCRIRSPKLEGINPFYVSPVELDIHPGDVPHYAIGTKALFSLVPQEGVQVQENSNPAAAEQHTIVLFLADGDIVPVSGEMITIEYSITLAQVAGAYEFSEITLTHDLAYGMYDIVGMRLVADGAVFARIVFKEGGPRPGVPCIADIESYDSNKTFRYGNMGVFGSFDTNHLPGIELVGSAAVGSATYTGYFDLIKRS